MSGGVAYLAIQYVKTLKGVKVVTSASRRESIEVAKGAGADAVFNYKNMSTDDVVSEVKKAFDGKLADVVYDTTYSSSSHESSAASVAANGRLIILGAEWQMPAADSTVQKILREKNATLAQSDVLRYWMKEEYVAKRMSGYLREALDAVQKYHVSGLIKPYISKTVDCTVDNIQRELQDSKAGNTLGKVAVKLV